MGLFGLFKWYFHDLFKWYFHPLGPRWSFFGNKTHNRTNNQHTLERDLKPWSKTVSWILWTWWYLSKKDSTQLTCSQSTWHGTNTIGSCGFSRLTCFRPLEVLFTSELRDWGTPEVGRVFCKPKNVGVEGWGARGFAWRIIPRSKYPAGN